MLCERFIRRRNWSGLTALQGDSASASRPVPTIATRRGVGPAWARAASWIWAVGVEEDDEIEEEGEWETWGAEGERLCPRRMRRAILVIDSGDR